MANYITGPSEAWPGETLVFTVHLDSQYDILWSATSPFQSYPLNVYDDVTFAVAFGTAGSKTVSCDLDQGYEILSVPVTVTEPLTQVPNTNNFSMSDVVEVVFESRIGHFVDCFSAANSNYFNSTYQGSKDRLSNFRDYGSHNYTPPATSLSVQPSALFFSWYSNGSSSTRTVTIVTSPQASVVSVTGVPSWLNVSNTSTTITLYPTSTGPYGGRSVFLNVSAAGYTTTTLFVGQEGEPASP